MERVLTKEMPPEKELKKQFDDFTSVEKNQRDMEKHRRVAIAPNGSVVPEVPKSLREYIMGFCTERGLRFESELIATLTDKERTREIYEKAFKRKFRDLGEEDRQRQVEEILNEIEQALNEEFPGHNVLLNTGLEVANEDDLKMLHKYTSDLDDFIAYASYLRERNISVGANVLVGAPRVEEPIRKALETVKFAFEKMQADKILMITWNPVKHTAAKGLYDQGLVDVMSATESAEIYLQAKAAYPNKEIEPNRMRSHVLHGKHPNFRESRINTDERKQRARENVRRIAKEVFKLN
ncbi:MAG: hypothetical protein HYZ79_02720 [Candidatus Melainabacteria bacterium]|nr:hypothetical protein [Candidatus Melainabacteria bacterium]